MHSNSEHWDTIFEGRDDEGLGWYEKNSSPTLKLMADIPDAHNSTIFVVGVGTSGLVEQLLAQHVKLILNDISAVALDRVKKRLARKADTIQWLCHDISQPLISKSSDTQSDEILPRVDIWIDRAVLHFLNDEKAISGYFDNVNAQLKIGGYALFAEFSKSSVTKCAGLPVHGYTAAELSERLGQGYSLKQTFNYNYTSPAGYPRPYLYCLFKRVK